ncbi:unnamed protein product [Leptosia nina]|uniref:Condensin complex subunit 2 n=1 Tax=Leptosia nina TaxID=320188 RepID=A0AAV1JWR3_9NEOP
MEDNILTCTPLRPLSSDQERNDDDVERSSLVASDSISSSPQATPRRLRATMTVSMEEHYQKINKEKAWHLQLIDFMPIMMQSHDARMDNFVTASTLLEACCKIYSFRVDAVHHDALKVARGLRTVAQSKRRKGDDAEGNIDGEAQEGATAPKKKKSNVIVANPETLNRDIETDDFVEQIYHSSKVTKILYPVTLIGLKELQFPKTCFPHGLKVVIFANHLLDSLLPIGILIQKTQHEPLGGLEHEEGAGKAIAACVARLTPAPLATVTDMRPTLPQHSRLEYSYCSIPKAWAGPSHWRLKNNRASKPSTAARVTVKNKKVRRTKRVLDFMGAGLRFDSRAEPTGVFEPTQPAKITLRSKTLASWNKNKYKTPIDSGLDETHFLKFFLRNNVEATRKRALEQSKGVSVPAPEPLTVDEHSDPSYCLNTEPEAYEWGNEEGAAAGCPEGQVNTQTHDNGDLEELLEPPAKITKMCIPYAKRVKKVDMKQLKHCTWKLLTQDSPPGEKEVVTETTFFKVYSTLPSKLSTSMRESLSVPLALLSVLHLANEKGLFLENRDDLKDFKIVGL